MPNIASFHPIVVHFAIALLVAGVVLRWISLTRKLPFTSPAAVLLIVAGTLAAVVAVKSGDDAHGPVERIPGVRDVVHEHEEHGERARNVFLAVAALEVAGLVLTRRKVKRAGLVLVASAVVGAVGLFFLYEAAEHGGELVYSYAGGVGTRTGEAEDVGRLLLAGLYHQARVDREQGRADEAARLCALAAERFPDDPAVQVLYADSLLNDTRDGAAALDLLRRLERPKGGSAELRYGMVTAEALKATGDVEAGRRELEKLREAFPESGMLREALERF
jgi:uncharacterized membrane protein